MVKESMKDIQSDEEMSGDDDDPELLHELNELSGTNDIKDESLPSIASAANEDITILLIERLKMYETAENNAKIASESSRARRFGRGIKTLQNLIKQSKAGKPINNDDIPPEVNVNIGKQKDPDPPVESSTDALPLQPPLRPAPPPPIVNATSDSDKPVLNDKQRDLLNLLNQRKDEYKSAAIVAKKSGDTETALNYVKIVKQFEMVVKAVESGQEVDLSGMPGPPGPVDSKTEENSIQSQENIQNENNAPEVVLITANSVSEALEQRLTIYKQQEEAAKEQGNSSKARRMGRIVKQYEQAIKLNNSGKPIPVDELPTPPGYAPIPVPGAILPEISTSPPQPSVPTKTSIVVGTSEVETATVSPKLPARPSGW